MHKVHTRYLAIELEVNFKGRAHSFGTVLLEIIKRDCSARGTALLCDMLLLEWTFLFESFILFEYNCLFCVCYRLIYHTAREPNQLFAFSQAMP